MTNRQLIQIGLLCLALFGYVANAKAQSFWSLPYDIQVTQCPMQNNNEAVPDFNSATCRTLPLLAVNPQHNAFWLSIDFDSTSQLTEIPAPLGLFLFGKAASRVWLNGTLLGSNGEPATDSAEIPGKMDAVFYIPEQLLNHSTNNLTLQMSGHHSLLALDYPIHALGIGAYGKPRQHVQRFILPGIALSGAFAVGVIYFVILSIGYAGKAQTQRFQYPLFAGMCLLALLQLGAELSRGLIDYQYPWQDIRLLIIVGCSWLFGILLLAYNSLKIARSAAIHWIYGGSLVSLAAVLIAKSFDTKTTLGILIPVLINLIQILWYLYKREKAKLKNWFIGHLVIALIIFFSSTNFHEFLHFLIIGLVLLGIFVQQAREYQNQQTQLLTERSHSAKLEFRLAQQNQSQTPSKLEISSAGQAEYINIADIAFGKAAGDYVELFLTDNSEKLFTGTLKQLESSVPEVFVRVHRSYLVNLNQVNALCSDKEANKKQHLLLLESGQQVPVSRRLLPTVRDSLKSNTN